MTDNSQLNKKEIDSFSDGRVNVTVNKDPLKKVEEKEKLGFEKKHLK